MTDKKALEVLESWLRVAYQNADGTDEDSAELFEALKTIFSLISRQQEEKQNLEIELQAMRGAANSYKAENSKLREQVGYQDIIIESCEKKLDKYRKTVGELITKNDKVIGFSCGKETEYIPIGMHNIFRKMAIKTARQELAEKLLDTKIKCGGKMMIYAENVNSILRELEKKE